MRNLCSQSIKTSEILSLPAPRATINHEITVRHAGTSSTHVSQHLLHQRTPMSQHKLAHCTNRLLKHCEAAPSEVSKCKKESTRTTMQCVFDPPLVHLTVSICVCLIAWNWLAVDWQTSFSTIYIYIYITLYHPTFSGILRLCLSSVNVQASPFILLTAASSHTCYLASAFTAPCCQRCNASNFTSQTAFLITLL